MKDNLRPIVTDMLKNTFVDTTDNFTEPDFAYNCLYKTATQNCVLHPIAAIRLGRDADWHLGTGIHNKNKTAQLPNFGRHNIIEYATYKDRKLSAPLPMNVYVRQDGQGERPRRTDATTVMLSWRGQANPSTFSRIEVADNPAIHESLDKSDLDVQQAIDATSPSNIAILMLPLLLNFVPIALLADVGTLTMLLYTIMSDVLTVIPLLIKGIELLIISSRKHRSVVVRISSFTNATRTDIAVAEMWAAECTVSGSVRSTGYAFLALSLVALVVGILSEIGAKIYVTRIRNTRQDMRFSLNWRHSTASSNEFSVSSGKSVISANTGDMTNVGVGAGNTTFGTETYEQKKAKATDIAKIV